jgi:hypothetical protein
MFAKVTARCLVPILCVEVGRGNCLVFSSNVLSRLSIQNQAQYAVESVSRYVTQSPDFVYGHAVLSFQKTVHCFNVRSLMILFFLTCVPVGSKLLVYPKQALDVAFLILRIRNHSLASSYSDFSIAALAVRYHAPEFGSKPA